MEFAGKEFGEYWDIIKIPTVLFIGWSVLGLIVAMISFNLFTTIFTQWAGIILSVALFGFIGWSAVQDHKGDVKLGTWSGALCGVISGFFGAVVGVLMFYTVPELVIYAASRGWIDPATMKGYMAISIYIGLVSGPIVSGLLGGIISSISSFIAQKV